MISDDVREARAEYRALQDLAAHLLQLSKESLAAEDIWGSLAALTALLPLAGRMLEIEGEGSLTDD